MTLTPPLLDPLNEGDLWAKLLKENFPPLCTMSAVDARQVMAERVQSPSNLNDVASTENVVISDNLKLRIYRPHNPQEQSPGILFAHGGGFVFGSIASHDGFCRSMCKNTKAIVISVEYGLAPEHRAPVAAENVYTALEWLALNAEELGIDASRILVGGDSAGGNLAAVVAIMAQERGGPSIAGQVLLYPVIAPNFETESYRTHGSGFLSTEVMQWFWNQYLGREGMPEPAHHVAPSLAPSLRGLPPAIMVIPGKDPLSSEGLAYARALRQAGVPVYQRFYPDMFHGFATIPDFSPGASARELLWSDISALLKDKE